jgi:hypothetical protein
MGRVELVLDALDALDRARGAHQLLDLALAKRANASALAGLALPYSLKRAN